METDGELGEENGEGDREEKKDGEEDRQDDEEEGEEDDEKAEEDEKEEYEFGSSYHLGFCFFLSCLRCCLTLYTRVLVLMTCSIFVVFQVRFIIAVLHGLVEVG